jgi:hypothetical protein
MNKTKKNLLKRRNNIYKLIHKLTSKRCKFQEKKIKKSKQYKSKKKILSLRKQICRTRKKLKNLEFRYRKEKIKQSQLF